MQRQIPEWSCCQWPRWRGDHQRWCSKFQDTTWQTGQSNWWHLLYCAFWLLFYPEFDLLFCCHVAKCIWRGRCSLRPCQNILLLDTIWATQLYSVFLLSALSVSLFLFVSMSLYLSPLSLSFSLYLCISPLSLSFSLFLSLSLSLPLSLSISALFIFPLSHYLPQT